jgi:hypothetical protein
VEAGRDHGQGEVWTQAWAPATSSRRCGRAAPRLGLTQGPAAAVLVRFAGDEDVSRPRVGAGRGELVRDTTAGRLVLQWRRGATGFRLEQTVACPGDRLPHTGLLLWVARSVR